MYYVLLAVLCSIGAINCELEAGIELITVPNITEYLMQNQNEKLLQTLQKSDAVRSQIRYTLGRRVSGEWKYFTLTWLRYQFFFIRAPIGDKLVAVNSASQSWPTLQDVKLTLTYPRTGTGAVVSYVEVLVEQVILHNLIVKFCTCSKIPNDNAKWDTAWDWAETFMFNAYVRYVNLVYWYRCYISILHFQSSNLGQGYVTDGGIGQRRITLVIEALRTTYFRHSSQIYGY